MNKLTLKRESGLNKEIYGTKFVDGVAFIPDREEKKVALIAKFYNVEVEKVEVTAANSENSDLYGTDGDHVEPDSDEDSGNDNDKAE